MLSRIVRAFYTVVLCAGAPLRSASARWRAITDRRAWGDYLARSAHYAEPALSGSVVWLDIGEDADVAVAPRLVQALRERLPQMRLVITLRSQAHRNALRLLPREGDSRLWLPIDTPLAVRRFLRHHQPSVGVVLDGLPRPNLMAAARQLRVPMVLANARAHDARAHDARSQGPFGASLLLRTAMRGFALVLSQTGRDAMVLRRSGGVTVDVCGSLRLDFMPSPKLVARGIEWRQGLTREVVLAADTHAGEEAQLIELWRRHKAPRPLLVIAPNDPARYDEVASLVEHAGLWQARRSGWRGHPPPDVARADVWLGDLPGEMPLYYAMSDVALLGGSFEPNGGHNVVEAAGCGCPLIMGPHTQRVAGEAEQSLAARASLRVTDLAQGVEQALSLADDPMRNAWVERALSFSAQHRGAAERMAERIVRLIGSEAAVV